MMEALQRLNVGVGTLGLSILVVAIVAAALFLVQRGLLKHYAEQPALQGRRQLLVLGAWLLGTLLVILWVPIEAELRSQLLGLLGIVLSATIALSATTFVGNAMAGVMLRTIRSFRVGDFLYVGEHAGRVSEIDLLHTEIQTEDRDLTTLPNLYLVTTPTKVVRASGTIISVEVSLGYDVPRGQIEQLLIAAAANAGLEEPFVQIRNLGDFSVSYRVAGLLKEVKTLIASRSRLRACTLDALHGGGVEIVSPNFMNTRALDAGTRIIPRAEPHPARQAPEPSPDALVFDKAEEAESLEHLRDAIAAINAEQDALGSELEAATDTAKTAELTARRERLQSQRERLEATLKHREESAED